MKYKTQNSKLKTQISKNIKRIGNWKLEIGNSVVSGAGFTFIELLTVMGIFAVIATLSVSIISLTFRGTKKSELLGIVRQNGNGALTQITRNVRYAKSLDSPASCVPSLDVSSIAITSFYNDEKIVYSCSESGITANGDSLIDTNTIIPDQCSLICSQQTINDPPTITLQFSLMPKNANGLVETNAPVSFRSTVTMRNYNNK